jgi:hypothetical protein
MVTTFTSQPERTLTHIYVRDAQKAFIRPCWTAGTEVYCGMCMRSAIQPVVGEVCPVCSSTVERILEVVSGGVTRPARQRRDKLIRVAHQDPRELGTRVLLDFLNSRRAGA